MSKNTLKEMRLWPCLNMSLEDWCTRKSNQDLNHDLHKALGTGMNCSDSNAALTLQVTLYIQPAARAFSFGPLASRRTLRYYSMSKEGQQIW